MIKSTLKPVVLAAGIWAILCPGRGMAQAAGQKTFASPDEAAHALFAAAENNNEEALLGILGPDGKEIVSSGDAAEDARNRAECVGRFKQMHRFAKEADGGTLMYIGAENWPFPIPLMNKGGAWYFDAAAGKQEVLFRRVGRNEMDAMHACRALVDAEILYFARAPHSDAGKRYAQRFTSSDADAGHDGLYWKGAADEMDSPLDSMIAAAGSDTAAGGEPMPFNGYYFRILTSQGKHARGGAKNYLAGGRMTKGFAFVAYPAEYRNSGVMTFIVGADGVVYQKDLGPDTVRAAKELSAYDPDSTWKSARGD